MFNASINTSSQLTSRLCFLIFNLIPPLVTAFHLLFKRTPENDGFIFEVIPPPKVPASA